MQLELVEHDHHFKATCGTRFHADADHALCRDVARFLNTDTLHCAIIFLLVRCQRCQDLLGSTDHHRTTPRLEL